MQNTMIAAPHKRPRGVSIIAVLQIVQGLFLLILGVLLLMAVNVVVGRTGTVTANGYSTNSLVMLITSSSWGGGFLLLGLGLLLFARYLWKLKRWAFWATVIIEVLLLLGGLWNLGAFPGEILIPYVNSLWMVISLVNRVVVFTQPFTTIWSILVGMIILPSVILLYILADANVRTAFHT